MLYLVMFVSSATCIGLSESGKIHNTWSKRALAALGILLPALMAGLRASSIGTDVGVYGLPAYTRALNSSGLFEYLSGWKSQYNGALFYDQLFWLIVYLCSRISPDYHLGLFVYNFLFVLFLYLGMKRCRMLYSMDVSLGMLCCYLLMYNKSLNLMRSMIAAAIVFYAVTFLPERKYVRFWILSCIAVLIHSSGIFSVVFFFMYLYCERRNGQGVRIDLIKTGILIATFLLMIIFGESLVRMLVDIGILRSNYLRYLPGGDLAKSVDSTTIRGTIQWLVSAITNRRVGIFLLISVPGYVLFWKKSKDTLFYFMCAVAFLLVTLLSRYSSDITRLGYYFIPFIVMNCLVQLRYLSDSLDLTCRRISIEKFRAAFQSLSDSVKHIWYYVLITVLLVFLLCDWHYNYSRGYSATAPYQFYWQEES